MRALFASLALLALSVAARAEGLVQITLEGGIFVPGGARVEIEVTSVDPANREHLRTASLDLLLAENTSAADVVALLARRLETAGIGYVHQAATTPARGPASIFVESASAIGLRLGHGLNGSITLCENAPTSARLLPGRDEKTDAQLRVTAHARNAANKESARVDFRVDLLPTTGLNDANSKLMLGAVTSGWRSELRSNEWWLPNPATDRGAVTGCTLDLKSNGDWRLDVTL